MSERLRTLGYLQDPLGRFLSSSESGRAGVLRTYLTVGSKVGILVGFLFFVLLSAGYLLVGRFVLVDARDIALLLTYLLVIAVVFGWLLGIVFAGGFALYGRLRRRSYPKVTLAAKKAALAGSLPLFVYLLLLWSRLRGSLPEHTRYTDLGAVIVCIVFTLVVGRLIFHGAFFLAAWSRPYERLEPRQRSRGMLSVVALLLAIAAAFAFLRWSSTWDAPAAPEASAFTPSPRSRILWIGVDGLDLDAVRAMADEGRLPTFQKLLDEGRLVHLADTERVHPLRFWADVSTGMDVRSHGVTGPTRVQPRGVSGLVFIERSAAGFYELLNDLLPLLNLTREEPLSAAHLREKSFREMIEQGGHAFGSIDWWLTHPLDPDSLGPVVTERAAWIAWTQGRGNGIVHASSEVHPMLREVFEDCLRFPETIRDVEALAGPGEPAADAEWLAEALDETAVSVAIEILRADVPELGLQVAFWGPNALHEALERELGPGFAAKRAFTRRMEHHYARLDGRLARLVAALPRDGELPWTVCLTAASQPVANANGEAMRSGGFSVFHGALVKPSSEASSSASVLDLVPTLLFAAGYPVSEDMPGRARDEWFVGSTPVTRIPSYGEREIRIRPDPAQSEEALRMLRRLGYL